MNSRQLKTWSSITILLGIAATFYTLYWLVLCPGTTLPIDSGDAGKNYYVYLYHIQYEKGVWFNGMNYPYGEHITFLDGQPALSIPLSYLHLSPEASLTILHLLLGLSYVLAIFFVFKILVHFKVRYWIASLFSVLVILLSPQVLRMPGHFGLSYLCFVPMIFYWLAQYNSTNKRKYIVYIIITGLFAAFLHMYFSAMIFFFVGSYVLGYWIFYREKFKTKLNHSLPLLIAAVGILIILQVFFIITDPVTDRTQYPWGILFYITSLYQVYTSIFSPIWKWIRESTSFGDISDGGEGYVYIGLVAAITFIISFITGIILLVRKRKEQLLTVNNKFSPVWLFAAFAMLLLGMGIPFIWNMEWLLDYLSAFRQFRSLGRFSWVFYYIITIYAVVVINNWHIKALSKGRKIFAYILVILCIMVWGYETTSYITIARNVVISGRDGYRSYFSKDEKNWQTFLQEHNKKASDYQAMIILPFFNLGTDKVFAGNDKTGWVLKLSGKASLQLHLPMIELWGSRCSWSQAFKQFRTVGGPLANKPLFEQTSNKPYLLMCFDEDSLDYDSKYLMQGAEYMGHYSQFHIYTLYPERLKQNDREYKDSMMHIYAGMSTGDTCIKCNSPYFIDHYDKGAASQKLFGSGAAPHTTVENTVIDSFNITPACYLKNYEFSMWTLLNEHDGRGPVYLFDFMDSTGHVFDTQWMHAGDCNDNIGMWFRGKYSFIMPINCKKILLRVRNLPVTSYIAADEILLKPADATVISKFANGQATVNNHALVK